MKKLIYILLIVLTASCKKEAPVPSQVKEFAIQSTSTGASYAMKVALPDGYNPSAQKYATIYVLDGEENFNFVSENCKQVSSDRGVSNVLVVSIGYGNDRAIDYTPSKADQGEGGAAKFMAFIKDELIPKMELEYGADASRNSRVILGHSFGGLLGAYAFTNYNTVFGNYILLSPSIWYDNEVLLKMEQENREINKGNHELVFMGIGRLESMGRMMAPYEAFHQRLQNNYSDIKIKSHLEPGLDHVGSKNPNIIEGLKFYFQNR